MAQHSEKGRENPALRRSLEEMLAQLTDQRAARGIRYALRPLLMIVLLAKLAGADKPLAMADWARERADWLRQHLQLTWRRMPHYITFRHLLQRGLLVCELEQQAGVWLAQYAAPEVPLYNLDGKTLCGTIPAGATQGTHLLALQQAQTNVVVAQAAVGAQTNEITAAPALLKTVALQEKIVSGDALQAQRPLSRQVVQDGGDYLWFVKKNQQGLYEQLEQAFAPTIAAPADVQTVTHYDKGHGRLEARQLSVSASLANVIDWPYLAQTFVLHRTRTELRSGKVTTQAVYGITSLAPLVASAIDLLTLTRQHWSIENGLHYRRDVTFGEDACRMKSPRAAQCLAVFNNLVIGLLRWLGWENCAQARRHYDAHWEEALQLIQGVYR
jgi:predicted transposase YbfD/YdcC